MTHDKLRVAVLGAGKWAEFAHIPGWIRDPRAEVVVLADVEAERAEALAPGRAAPPSAGRIRHQDDPNPVARGLRRPHHRYRTLVGRLRPDASHRPHAKLYPRAAGARLRRPAPHEHRRRRCVHWRVHERHPHLDPIELRHDWELSRRRSTDLRREGRHHLPARRRVWRRRDHPHRDAGRRGV